MKPIHPLLVCAVLICSSTPTFAAGDMPAVGTYGFDWLKKPGTAQCLPVTRAMISQFKKCEITDGSFGGDPAQAHKCTVSKHSEFMVYESKAACLKGLETEQSNE